MLRQKMYNKLLKFVEEERQKDTNEDLLGMLEEAAAGELCYWHMLPEDRNAVNIFVREAKDFLLKEAFLGKFSFDTMLEAMLVTMLETGWRTYQWAFPDADSITRPFPDKEGEES